jgi:Homing endonuclease associated repeat
MSRRSGPLRLSACRRTRPFQDARWHEYLSHRVINETPGIPSAGTYINRFGSMERVCELAGFPQGVGNNLPDGPQPRSRKVTIKMSNETLLALLRQLFETRGRVSRTIIDESKGIPSSHTYVRRFGSMARAYRRIGLTANVRRIARD